MASSYLETTLATLALIHGLVDAVSVHGDKNGDSQPEREGWKNLLKIKIDKKAIYEWFDKRNIIYEWIWDLFLLRYRKLLNRKLLSRIEDEKNRENLDFY